MNNDTEENILNSTVNGWVLEMNDCDAVNPIVGSFGRRVTFRDVITALSHGDDFHKICRMNFSPESKVVYAAFDGRVKTTFVTEYLRKLRHGKMVFIKEPLNDFVGVDRGITPPLQKSFKSFYSRLRAYVLNLNPPKIHLPFETDVDPRVLENRRSMLDEQVRSGWASEKKEMECEIYISMKRPHSDLRFCKWVRLWLSTMRILVIAPDAEIPANGYECTYF